MSENSFIRNESIQFEGNQGLKKDAIELLDKVLKQQGDLGTFGDLRGGIEKIIKDMNIKIIDENNFYSIDIYPKSNSDSHDFGFTIDKKTEKRSNVTIGEVLPPPNFDN